MGSDPRDLGGGISGPGGPFDYGGVVVDSRRSVLMEHVNVAQVDNPSDGRTFWAMALEGRINRSPDRAEVLYLFDVDGAAAIITELHGLAARAGRADELNEACKRRWDEMP